MTIRKTFKVFLLFLVSAFMTVPADAQDAKSYTPPHMWEVGLHVGHSFSAGDIDFDPSFSGGIHVRRALDYVFSIRGELAYQTWQGRDGEDEIRGPQQIVGYNGTAISGSLAGVISFNNLRWDRATADRKWNPYGYAGGGIGSASIDGIRLDDSTIEVLELLGSGQNNFSAKNIAWGIVGAGISYKIGSKFNIGLEHQVDIPFGRQADMLDAYRNDDQPFTTYRDILQYTNIRLNFNLGGDDKSEPLYWINPLENVITDISELQARPVFDLTDTDGDGVIDMIDAEKDSPEGAPVNTRGEALDSDGDGVADYQDEEPYSPPGYSVDGKGIAQQPEYLTKDAIQGMIDKSLEGYNTNKNAIADWFLPMIHFNLDSYSIRYSDYSALANVATVMKNNPDIRIAVKGYTDKTASDNYNQVLSYNRAKSAIDHLVQNYGVSRDRLVLNYGGENNTLVPQSGVSLMNRRVEFKVATDETEMARPDGPNAGNGSFGGNRAGY